MAIKFRPTPWVFISSVGDECNPFRESATRAALRSRFVPVKMETWSAEARNSYDACKRHLSKCNVMILIFAERYGSIHIESGKSYTEMEFDAALELGIPVLAFLGETPILPTDKIDLEDLERAKRFRERLGTMIQGRFKSNEKLELLIFQSLQEWLNDVIEASMKHDTHGKIVINGDYIINDKGELDIAAFQRLQEIINSDWIKGFEYVQLTSPQFVSKKIRDKLIDYCYESEKPENEFINQKVASVHNNFIQSITAFLDDIAIITTTHDYNGETLIINTKEEGQRNWIKNYDQRYDREVKIIIDRAESIINTYKNFIRICRQENIFK